MQYSISAIGGKPAPGEGPERRATTVGFVCGLARSSLLHAQMSSGALIDMLYPAMHLGQVKIYFNNYGECMGYVVWATLAPDVERRFIRDKNINLHPTEWNEGISLWIIDFLVLRGSLQYVLADLRDRQFAAYETLTYFRIKNGKRIFKRVGRTDGGRFFRNPCA